VEEVDVVIDIIAVAVVADVPIVVVEEEEEEVPIEVEYTFIPTKRNVPGSKNGGGNAVPENHSLMWNHPQNSWRKRRLGRLWNGIIL